MNLYAHAVGVKKLATRIGEKLMLTDDDLKKLSMAGYYHDIGKIIIPKHLLYKTEKITKEEYETLKKHVIYSEEILKRMNINKEIIVIVRYHHERWDGMGYPDKLKGEQIPLLSRIIAIADSYDAMTNNRAYKKSIPREKAIEELINNKGKQFDPNLIEFIEKNIDTIFDKINL